MIRLLAPVGCNIGKSLPHWPLRNVVCDHEEISENGLPVRTAFEARIELAMGQEVFACEEDECAEYEAGCRLEDALRGQLEVLKKKSAMVSISQYNQAVPI